MRHFKILLLILLVSVSLSSCCVRSKTVGNLAAGDTDSIGTAVEIALDSAIVEYPYSFSISLISKGEGIRTGLIEQIDGLLNPLAEAGYISIERYSWGREGELDYCVRVHAIPPDQESELYAHLREMDQAEELMIFSQDGACIHKR